MLEAVTYSLTHVVNTHTMEDSITTSHHGTQVVIHAQNSGHGTALHQPWVVPERLFPGLIDSGLGKVTLFVLRTGDLSESHPDAPDDWSNRSWVVMEDALRLATTIATTARGLAETLSGRNSVKKGSAQSVCYATRSGARMGGSVL